MNKYLVNLVIEFALRQLTTYTSKIDWKLVEKDLHERIKDLVPESTYASVCELIDVALSALKSVLSNTAQIKMILELLASEKMPQAYDILVGLLNDYFKRPKLSSEEQSLKDMMLV